MRASVRRNRLPGVPRGMDDELRAWRRGWLSMAVLTGLALLAAAGLTWADEPQARVERPSRAVTLLPMGGGPAGLRATDITEELRRHFGAPADRGALVTQVTPDGLAARLGLVVGDVVIEVDGNPIRTARDLELRLSLGRQRGLAAKALRKKKTVELALESEAPTAENVRGLLSDQQRKGLERQLQAQIDQLESRLKVLRARLARLREESAAADAEQGGEARDAVADREP